MELSIRARVAVLAASLVFAVAGLCLSKPMPQPLEYHRFADVRQVFGVLNGSNVLSNLPFALAGLIGIWITAGDPGRKIFHSKDDAWPYQVFFTGLILVGVGSSFYHLRPDNGRLLWDRLPMSIAFMALFAAVIADRIDRRLGNRIALPVLLVIGIASVLYWSWTETLGRGDLRFYFLVQFYPMLAIPLICVLFPKGSLIDWQSVLLIFVLYTGAKALEIEDAALLRVSNGLISGHTVKHLLAAAATAVVIPMLLKSRSKAVA